MQRGIRLCWVLACPSSQGPKVHLEEANPLLPDGAAPGTWLAATAKFLGEDSSGVEVWARRSPSAAGRLSS